MNIFATSDCPTISAYNLPHTHVVKMIVESAQMLSTCQRLWGNTDERLYKQAYPKHPSTIWTRASKENYMWLYEHMMALGEVYQLKTNKVHATIEKLSEVLSVTPSSIPDKSFVFSEYLGTRLPTPAMPDEFLSMNTSTDVKYQHYLNSKYKMWIETENKSCKNLKWTVDYPHWLDNDVKEFAEKLLGDIK